ncbi:MAG TPA: ABC transporter ATP-binding protein [Vicinamibacterales bacterium]|nr:ABC transporter ATP-binding protein [Vicinamibacterales bacterium]
MIAELRGVTKRYGRVTALDNVTLALEAGRVTAVLGPNGAGKTSAVKLLMGLTRPTLGTASLFDVSPRAPEARRRTGVMLQIAKVPETLTVREHVHLFCSYYPAPMPVAAALDAAGLTAVADRRFGALSGGQRQRVQFALAICGNPDLLFLDEPTAGMDVESRRAFWQQIRSLASLGRSILLTTHYLEEADALADRIVMLNGGRIVADGAPHQIKARTASRRIRCVTSFALAAIQALPDVQSVRLDGAAVEILTSHAEPVVRELLAGDAGLSGLEVSGAGLEDAFLTLTSAATPTAHRSEDGHRMALVGGMR